MDRSAKRLVISATGGFAALAALAIGAVVAFACIPIAMLNLSPNTVAPGQTVTANIQAISVSAGQTAPAVQFHWQTLNGPVLATATPGQYGTTATFTVPQGTQSGNYLIVATQQQQTGSSTWGMPARAVLHVTANGSAPVSGPSTVAPASSNTAGLATQSGLSAGVLALIALGVAAVAVTVVGAAVWGAERLSPRAEKVRRS